MTTSAHIAPNFPLWLIHGQAKIKIYGSCQMAPLSDFCQGHYSSLNLASTIPIGENY